MEGLSWSAWLLIAASIVPGIALATAFFLAHRDEAGTSRDESDSAAGERRS